MIRVTGKKTPQEFPGAAQKQIGTYEEKICQWACQ